MGLGGERAVEPEREQVPLPKKNDDRDLGVCVEYEEERGVLKSNSNAKRTRRRAPVKKERTKV